MVVNSIDEILEKIKAKTLLEHREPNVELKSSWGTEDGPKISALGNKLNQRRTWLIIGVADDGSPCNKNESWAKQVEQILSQNINLNLDPVQTCTEISCKEVNGSWIAIVAIENPGSVVNWKGKAYKAAGTTIEEMSPSDVMAMTVMLPGLSDYSAQEWKGVITDPILLLHFASLVSIKRADSFLQNLDGLTSNDILLRLGIAERKVAALLFGDYSFRVIKYDASGNPITNESRKGLFNILTEDFISSIQVWTKEQTGAKDPPYPPKAIREALANAIAHAAYFDGNGDIIIEMFPEKLIISNLCLPESTFFANRWLSRSHRSVNRMLMETLRLAGFVDELGRGKNLIFSESIKNGKKSPLVSIENAGRYNRWSLCLYGGTTNKNQLQILSRLKNAYKDEHKVLIAYALVLWRDQPLENIQKFIDNESYQTLKEILTDLKGPILYSPKQSKMFLRRWASIVLEEGKDSKVLSIAEEEDLKAIAYDQQMKYNKGYINPKDIRNFVGMGHTASEKAQSSELLSKWAKEGIVSRVRKGVYKFKSKEMIETEKRLEMIKQTFEVFFPSKPK